MRAVLAIVLTLSAASSLGMLLVQEESFVRAAPQEADAVRLDLLVNDIIFDPGREVMYATVGDTSAKYPNKLVTIDPITRNVVSSRSVGTKPTELAITADGSALYVGIDGRGEVQKFSLPDFAAGWSFEFGIYQTSYVMKAGDIEVLPGTVDTIAVSRRVDGISPSLAGIVVIDAGIARPNTTPGHIGSNSIVFGNDASMLYGSDTESSANEFQRHVVDADGIVELDVTGLGGGDLVFHDGLIYGSNGKIIDPVGPSASLADTLPVGTAVAVDQGSNRVFYMVGDWPVPTLADITVYDAVSREPVSEWSVPGQPGYSGRLISLGADYVAYVDTDDPESNLLLVRLAEPIGPGPFGEFTPLTPARILDTRNGNGRGGVPGPVGTGGAIDVQVTGRGGVPGTGVSAVVMNATVTQPTAPSFLTVWPTGLPLPEISNLNYLPGQTVPNLVTVAVGPDGKVSAFNAFGSTHVIFDVVGFYADATGPQGGRFHAIDPYRYFDTRNGAGGVGLGPLGPDSALSFKATGIGGVPVGGVSGVVMNVTITQPTQPSYLTVYPGDVSAPPNASNLNYLPGATVPNLVTVRVPADGMIAFYNRFGTVHLLADVVGYYDDDRFTEAGRFVGLAPSRIFDSRVDFTEPFFEDSGTTLPIAGSSGVPLTGASAAVLNVTATQTTAPGYVTVFPDDLCDIPLASNLNFGPGQTIPNLVMVRIASPGGCADPNFPGGVFLYNRFGYTHLIVDLFGYFTDSSSYDEYVTITDDTGTISIDVPVEWNDIFRAPVGVPPEPALAASPDIDIFFDGWDVPGVYVRVSRTAATTYPTPLDYLASLGLEDLADECATTNSGPYDDGTYVGNFVSAERCGAGNKGGFLIFAAQAPGTDYYLRIVFDTITQRDVDAVDGVIASLEIDPSF